jgi:putative ATP-dependent endonuclease of the OLD family
MKLLGAKIQNFRLLHDVEIKFDESSTSIVGKNNSGKTSLTSIFKIFLSKGSIFSFDDFSLKSYEDFKKLFEEYLQMDEENKEQVLKSIQQKIPKIQLVLDIEFSEKDNWTLLKPFFISLEDEQKIKILCEYSPESSEKFFKTLKKYHDRDAEKKIDIIEHIRVIYSDHYKIKIRPYSDTIKIIPDSVRHEDLKSLLNVCFINAQRTLDDSNTESKSKLSKIFHEHFSKENEKDETLTEDLLNSISLTSLTIDKDLKTFFSQYIDHFKMFGFPGVSNEEIELKSDLNPENLFRNSIKLYYNNEGKILPEKYNGLGYSNLIFIISQIIGFYNAIRENKGCLNLIFIEEPEAHMHPQMQIVFNKNITSFLNKMGLTAQTVITTHSSHILASSKFSSVKYFTKLDNVSSKVKDLMDFSMTLKQEEKLRF